MPPDNFRKISHSKLEISLYLSHFNENVKTSYTQGHSRNSTFFRPNVEHPNTIFKKVS